MCLNYKIVFKSISILSLFFLLIMLSSTTTKTVIILIHGSFAANAKWYGPSGNFYKTLEQSAKQFNQKVISFSWSGIPQNIEIIKGSEKLAQLILSYPENEEIILIGHSHGGNVINFASRLLFDPIKELMANQISISELISQAYKKFSKQLRKRNEEKKENEQENIASLIINIIQEIKKSKQQKNLIQFQKIKNLKNKKYIINKVYLLATPVDTKRFSPEMDVIKNIYNFSSENDYIQTVAGLFKKTYPEHDRIANLFTKIEDKSKICNPPSHKGMHDPILAKWLLSIPEKLKTDKIGNFENFIYKKNGDIYFYKDKNPEYILKTN